MADELALHHNKQGHGPSTPKRKRPDDRVSPDAAAAGSIAAAERPNFSLPPRPSSSTPDAEDPAAIDSCASPSTKMAHQLRGLGLESGTSADTTANPSPSSIEQSSSCSSSIGYGLGDEMDSEEDSMRKRQKFPSEHTTSDHDGESPPGPNGEEPGRTPTPVPAVPSQAVASRRPSLQRALPSINRLPTVRTVRGSADGKSRHPHLHNCNSNSNNKAGKKRSSTPPLVTRSTRASGLASSPEDSEVDDDLDEERIVDPLRASLTWHEDEITVYDPEDSEDDGLGINGIGFKPSQTVADSRAARRKQQLVEYRRREESEARERRCQRRRAAAAAAAACSASTMGSGSDDESRKVRFMDAEPAVVVLTG